MEYTTLLHIDPSQYKPPIKKMHFILEHMTLLHIDPSQV